MAGILLNTDILDGLNPPEPPQPAPQPQLGNDTGAVGMMGPLAPAPEPTPWFANMPSDIEQARQQAMAAPPPTDNGYPSLPFGVDVQHVGHDIQNFPSTFPGMIGALGQTRLNGDRVSRLTNMANPLGAAYETIKDPFAVYHAATEPVLTGNRLVEAASVPANFLPIGPEGSAASKVGANFLGNLGANFLTNAADSYGQYRGKPLDEAPGIVQGAVNLAAGGFGYLAGQRAAGAIERALPGPARVGYAAGPEVPPEPPLPNLLGMETTPPPEQGGLRRFFGDGADEVVLPEPGAAALPDAAAEGRPTAVPDVALPPDVPVAADTASGRLFGLSEPAQGISKADRALNSLKEAVGIGVPENDVATPIMRERQRVKSVIESQSARMGAIADDTAKAFDLDKAGRITDLPGQPTLQDVAARLPQYDRYLLPEQRAALERLRQETAPFAEALKEQGVDLASRADVQEGGFYLPRGRADVEGADVPLKVGTGRGGAGGKKGFEKGAVFDSQAEGIDAGYQYPPLRDALQSYAKDAGNRAVDSWTANSFKASGEGQTAKDVILASNPGLAAKKAALDANLTRLRGLASGMTERGQRAIEQWLHDPTADSVDDLIYALPDSQTVMRGKNVGAAREDVLNALAQVKQDITDLRPDWNKALEQARSPRNRGSIGFAGLNGSTFPDEVANVANKYLNAEKPATGAGSQVLSAANAFNGLMRGLRASADVSFMGIQGLLGAVQHPRQYGTALVTALKSLADPAAEGAFIRTFDETAQAAGRPTSADWNAVGNRLGGEQTEFAVRGGLPRIPNAIQNAPIVKQSNRAFGVFGDTLRLASNDALYAARESAGKAVGPDEMADIAKFSNLMTGWSSRRFGGDIGGLVEFAPRFFQSQLDLAGNALTNWGRDSIVGQQSRQALVKLAGIGTLLTVGANEARGYKTDFDPNSPNFMRIRDVGGDDVSLFGPWDSLLRAATSAAKGDVTYLARSKASPLVSLAWDEISGKSFTGEDTRTPDYLLRSLLPFGLSQVGQQGRGAADLAIGLTGAKATPLSPTDMVQLGRYKEIPAEQQLKAFNAQSWNLIGSHPELPENLQKIVKQYPSHYEWQQARLAEFVKEAEAQGYQPAAAQYVATQALANHPIQTAYEAAKNAYERRWIAANPALAEKVLEEDAKNPSGPRRLTPTKEERAFIEAGARAQKK